MGAQELSRRGLAKADIEVGLHAVFGSDPNSVQLCPPGAEECALDDAAHEPDRAPPTARRQPFAEDPCACVAGARLHSLPREARRPCLGSRPAGG